MSSHTASVYTLKALVQREAITYRVHPNEKTQERSPKGNVKEVSHQFALWFCKHTSCAQNVRRHEALLNGSLNRISPVSLNICLIRNMKCFSKGANTDIHSVVLSYLAVRLRKSYFVFERFGLMECCRFVHVWALCKCNYRQRFLTLAYKFVRNNPCNLTEVRLTQFIFFDVP